MPLTHLAARELEQKRSAAAAEFTRQLPLHADTPISFHTDPEEIIGAARTEPGWTSSY